MILANIDAWVQCIRMATDACDFQSAIRNNWCLTLKVRIGWKQGFKTGLTERNEPYLK